MRLSAATEAVSAARAAQRDADQACRELAKALRLVEPPSYQPPDARRVVPPALQASTRTAMDAMAACQVPTTP